MTGARWTWFRRLALVLAAVLLGLGAMIWRALAVGESALERAEAAFDRGELRESIREARRAASSIAPGSSHVERGFTRLMVVARGAEASGDIELSRLAWEAVRGAALEGQSSFGPASDHLARANQQLARLAARQAGERGLTDPAALERALERDLARNVQRSATWSLGLGVGLVLAALGLGWGALRGIRADGQLVRRELVIGVMLASAGAACWAFAVYRA
jgi:hypothetical protein